MKKLFLIIILFLVISNLIACEGNKVSPNEGTIIFSFPEGYQEYLPYEEIPNFIFEFDGIVNTVIGASTSNKKVLGKNDDFIISDLLENLFKKYQAMNRLTVQVLQEEKVFETRINNLVKNDDGSYSHKSHVVKVENQKLYNEIAYINLENGLTLSVEYRRFDSIVNNEVKTLYTWRYVNPLSIVLHYPLMIKVNENNKKEIFIVPTPTKVIYRLGVSSQLPISTILEKENYLSEYYQMFPYPNYNEDPRAEDKFVLEEDIQYVKNYYINYFNGEEIDGKLYFSYLGKDFSITFLDTTFKINFE